MGIYNLCCGGWYNIWVQCCYYGHGFFSVLFDYRNLICGNVLVRGLVIGVRKTGVHVGDNKSQSWKCVRMWFLCEALICSAHRIVILILYFYIAFYQRSWGSNLTNIWTSLLINHCLHGVMMVNISWKQNIFVINGPKWNSLLQDIPENVQAFSSYTWTF